jgi:hypothetical protein
MAGRTLEAVRTVLGDTTAGNGQRVLARATKEGTARPGCNIENVTSGRVVGPLAGGLRTYRNSSEQNETDRDTGSGAR